MQTMRILLRSSNTPISIVLSLRRYVLAVTPILRAVDHHTAMKLPSVEAHRQKPSSATFMEKIIHLGHAQIPVFCNNLPKLQVL